MIQRFIARVSRYSSVLKAGAVCMALIASSLNVQAQGVHEFQKYFGDIYEDVANKIAGAANNNYIITGKSVTNNGSSDLFLMRTGEDGGNIWRYTIAARLQGNPATNDWGNSVIATSDGGFVAVGAAQYGSYKKAYIVKVNQNGNLLWTNMVASANQAEFYDVIEDNGQYVVVGYDENDAGNRDVFLAKYSAAGALVSHIVVDGKQTPFSPSYEDEGHSIVRTTSGYAITGRTRAYNQGTTWEMLLMEIDANFSVVSNMQSFYMDYGQFLLRDMRGNNLISTLDGGLVVVGQLQDYTPVFPAYPFYKGFVMRFDGQRNLLWTRSVEYFGDAWSDARQVKELPRYDARTGAIVGSNGYVIGGYCEGLIINALSSPELVAASAYIMRIDNNGNGVVSQSYRPPANTYSTALNTFNSIVLRTAGLYSLADKGVAAVGQCTHNFVNGIDRQDAYLVKTNGFSLPTPCYMVEGPELTNREVRRQTIIPVKATVQLSPETWDVVGGYVDVMEMCYKYTPYFEPTKKMGGGVSGYGSSNVEQIAPNPAMPGETIQVSLNIAVEEKTDVVFTVTDVTGRIAYNGIQAVTNSGEAVVLNLPKLAAGVYMVNASWLNQVTHLKLVITE